MLGTFEALVVFLIAGLPGAMYVWGWERQVGQWGLSAADRFFRFVAGSAVFQAIFAPFSYLLWRDYVRNGVFRDAHGLPLFLWPVAIAYVLLPFLAGAWVGALIYSDRKLARRLSQFLNGADPAPRAWDHVFGSNRNVSWIRLKLKDGTWLGGLFIRLENDRSYASGFPYDQELYLCRTAPVDETGAFVDKEPKSSLGPGILVRWSEVQYLALEDA